MVNAAAFFSAGGYRSLAAEALFALDSSSQKSTSAITSREMPTNVTILGNTKRPPKNSNRPNAPLPHPSLPIVREDPETSAIAIT